MQENSFQKNGFLKINQSSGTYQTDPNKLGRRTIEEIRDDMASAKYKLLNTKKEEKPTVENIKKTDHKQRIDNLKNFYRWK